MNGELLSLYSPEPITSVTAVCVLPRDPQLRAELDDLVLVVGDKRGKHPVPAMVRGLLPKPVYLLEELGRVVLHRHGRLPAYPDIDVEPLLGRYVERLCVGEPNEQENGVPAWVPP